MQYLGMNLKNSLLELVPRLLYNYLISPGFTNDSMAASKSLNLRNSGTGRLDRSFQANGGATRANSESTKTAVSYVIEQCENEFNDTYRECMKSTSGQCLITRLSPGQTYRFRVYGVNVDGVPGPKSESVIVHTMLETPSPPVPNGKSVPVAGLEKLFVSSSVFPNKVVLRWKNRRDGVSSRDKGVIERMLGDWAGVGNDDGGVSIEVVFANYDRYSISLINIKFSSGIKMELLIQMSLCYCFKI
jgi:hypothetical protein